MRAWAARYGIPCSTTGALKRWVREGYERVGGGVPDALLWGDAGLGDTLPAQPQPAVEPLGQDLAPSQMTHAQKLDEAERLLGQKKTPAQVAEATGLDVAEVRDLLPRPGSRRR